MRLSKQLIYLVIMRAKAILLLLFLPSTISAVVVDRIAAIIDREVITVSELEQTIALRIIPSAPKEDEDTYRRRVLDTMIAQTLHFREVERFGAEDVSADSVESRVREASGRFSSEAEFESTVARLELTPEAVRTLIKRQLQVESYIEERFSPLIFVSIEEIELYYRNTWQPQRVARKLANIPLAEAREEIRSLLKAERLQREINGWTEQLRSRANVDFYTTSL